jgi:hypothetical protein
VDPGDYSLAGHEVYERLVLEGKLKPRRQPKRLSIFGSSLLKPKWNMGFLGAHASLSSLMQNIEILNCANISLDYEEIEVRVRHCADDIFFRY